MESPQPEPAVEGQRKRATNAVRKRRRMDPSLLMLLAFIFAGLADVLIPQPVLSRWLGSQRPGQAILVGWAAGLLIPGGPYLVFPILASLFQKGPAPGPLITLITAKTLVSPVRMLTYEAPLLGWPLTLARFVPGVLLPPFMGLIGAWLFAVFSDMGR